MKANCSDSPFLTMSLLDFPFLGVTGSEKGSVTLGDKTKVLPVADGEFGAVMWLTCSGYF